MNLMRMKAHEYYGLKLRDVEVQMLPKGCTAVIDYREQMTKKNEQKFPSFTEKENATPGNSQHSSRRSEYAKREKIRLGERRKTE